MLIEQDYPKQVLIVPSAYGRKTPEKGDKVLVQGDPAEPILRGEVIGALEAPDQPVVKIYVDVAEDQDGALELAEWLQTHGDVGIMLDEDD